ncbi:MAG: outer membrane protein assembly factor BamA [Betaproteobacteria bacterium]
MKIQTNRFRLRTASIVSALSLLSQLAWAVEPFPVRDIRVEGLRRVEPGTVFASLPLRVGDTYSDDKGAAAIRALFALGLFKDVRIDVADGVLVVIVEERPTVAEVEFSGAKEFDKDVLKKAMRDVGLAEGRPFDKALADRAEQELLRQYINRSLYGAEVVTTVTPADRNRVNLTFTIAEGEPSKIKEIRLVGNKVFSESTLRSLFDLDTGGYLSWYTKSNHYARAKLNADLETLRSYYLNRGYLEFKIDSTPVAISANKQDIAITVNLTEGERFVVSSVKLEGNYLTRDNEFKSLVKVRPGQAYNAEEVAQTIKQFTDHFGNFGYAFARVESRPEIDRSNNSVAIVLQADPARRAYVRRVNIAGNNVTRDEVVRREFRQMESSWYDGEKIKASRDRVDRLGYFKEVNIETQEVPGSNDQVDLLLTVVEKPTGSISLGASFSSADRFGLQFGIKQENAFGSGDYVGLEVNTSKYNKVLSVQTTDPYFTPDGISRTLSTYYRASKPYADLGGNYELATTGAGLSFGVPFNERDVVFFGAAVEQTKIIPGTNIPVAYLAYASEFGYTSSAVPLTVGWGRDDRDSATTPTKGSMQRLSGEWGIIGDARYVRTSYQNQWFLPITKQITFGTNVEIGLGKGLNGRPYPVFKNFYSGGLGSVRGFEQGTLGPRDVSGSVVGGPNKINLNAELSSPFPGAGNDKSLRGYAFLDAGNVFGESEKLQFSELRSSAGVGVSWISPMGPLRLSYAKPIKKLAGDKIQALQFNIGTSF